MTLGHLLVIAAIVLSPFLIIALMVYITYLHLPTQRDVEYWKKQPP